MQIDVLVDKFAAKPKSPSFVYWFLFVLNNNDQKHEVFTRSFCYPTSISCITLFIWIKFDPVLLLMIECAP